MGVIRAKKIGRPSVAIPNIFENPGAYGYKIYKQQNVYSAAAGSRTWFPSQNQPADVVNGSKVYLKLNLSGQWRTGSGSPTNTDVFLRTTTGGAFITIKTIPISYTGAAFTYVQVEPFNVVHTFNIGTGTDYNLASSEFSRNITFLTTLLYKPA